MDVPITDDEQAYIWADQILEVIQDILINSDDAKGHLGWILYNARGIQFKMKQKGATDGTAQKEIETGINTETTEIS